MNGCIDRRSADTMRSGMSSTSCGIRRAMSASTAMHPTSCTRDACMRGEFIIKRMLRHVLASVGLERLDRSIWTRTRNFGLQYQCPMCRAHLKAFLPGGACHAVLTEKSIVGG